MDGSTSETSITTYDELMAEMSTQYFDTIRFASYRTACKIRFVQKKTNFYLVDVWNAIEAVRDAGFATVIDLNAEISEKKLEQLLLYIFVQLNKRLPPAQHVSVMNSVKLMQSFLISAYDPSKTGQLRVFAIKLALGSLAAGKLQDKLRYLFSLAADVAGARLQLDRFRQLLRDLLQLACCVAEAHFYQYDEKLVSVMLGEGGATALEQREFSQLFYAAGGPPPILSWFMILHKLAQVEQVRHNTSCSCCGRQNFVGFRYKCQKCFNYNLCQLCFWQGKATGSHNAETHSCKEYLHWKSGARQLGDSLRRSFRLGSSNSTHQRVELDEQPVVRGQPPAIHSPTPIQSTIFSSPAKALPIIPNSSDRTSAISSLHLLPMRSMPITSSGTVGAAGYALNSTMLPTVNGGYLRFDPTLGEAYGSSSLSPVRSPATNCITLESFTQQVPANDLYLPHTMDYGINYGLDEEHRLIARYAANLANSDSMINLIEQHQLDTNSVANYTSSSCSNRMLDEPLNTDLLLDTGILRQEQIICELERKNRRIMRDIQLLREYSPSSDYNSLVASIHNNYNSLGHSSDSSCSDASQVELFEELAVLRDRKDELETHLGSLKESRRELKSQLEHLIKLSKNYGQMISTPPSANSTLSQASGKQMQAFLASAGQEENRHFQSKNSLDSMESRISEQKVEENNVSKSNENPLMKAMLKLVKDLMIDDDDSDLRQMTSNHSIDESKSHEIKQIKELKNGNFSTELEYKNKSKDIKEVDEIKKTESNDFDLPSPNGISNGHSTKKGDDEKIAFNNILNRDIDHILKRNRTMAQTQPRRINKYMQKYGSKNDVIKATPISTLSNTNREPENNDANSSDANSVVSSSSLATRCDIKSQPPMNFSSIAYVNANRQIQNNQMQSRNSDLLLTSNSFARSSMLNKEILGLHHSSAMARSLLLENDEDDLEREAATISANYLHSNENESSENEWFSQSRSSYNYPLDFEM